MSIKTKNMSLCCRQRFFSVSFPVGLKDDFCGIELEMV